MSSPIALKLTFDTALTVHRALTLTAELYLAAAYREQDIPALDAEFDAVGQKAMLEHAETLTRVADGLWAKMAASVEPGVAA